jgi:hypothetical protein
VNSGRDILQHIGRTPLVSLPRIARGLPVPVLVKCEHMNPGGSVKDRIAKAIVDDAEARGVLRSGMTLIEATAGNTGVGLALVAAARGYGLVCVMPEKMSVDKRVALTSLGARVVITPRFPYYATRSEIAERVLHGDNVALQRIEAARPALKSPAVSTIGYEGRTLESYLNELLRAGVTLLCDVRRNPISRKYGFSKGTLAKGCEGVGIRYEHLPELGIASEQRRSLETQADYDALFVEYERESLPKQGEALAKIRGWIRSEDRVALTCYERLPEQCHRHCVAEALERELGNGLAARHL